MDSTPANLATNILSYVSSLFGWGRIWLLLLLLCTLLLENKGKGGEVVIMAVLDKSGHVVGTISKISK
jgi:hypothetical protein